MMMYPTKTALVIRLDLLPWQVANVAAFLSGGLPGAYPEIVGEAYRDSDGRPYTPMIREPMFISRISSSGRYCVEIRSVFGKRLRDREQRGTRPQNGCARSSPEGVIKIGKFGNRRCAVASRQSLKRFIKTRAKIEAATNVPQVDDLATDRQQG
jgi:hypothetical protein